MLENLQGKAIEEVMAEGLKELAVVGVTSPENDALYGSVVISVRVVFDFFFNFILTSLLLRLISVLFTYAYSSAGACS